MIRLYFNRHGDKPWSVDSGPGTQEQQFVEVCCRVGVLGITAYRALETGEDPAVFPCAWVQFPGCVSIGNGAYAVIAPDPKQNRSGPSG